MQLLLVLIVGLFGVSAAAGAHRQAPPRHRYEDPFLPAFEEAGKSPIVQQPIEEPAAQEHLQRPQAKQAAGASIGSIVSQMRSQAPDSPEASFYSFQKPEGDKKKHWSLIDGYYSQLARKPKQSQQRPFSINRYEVYPAGQLPELLDDEDQLAQARGSGVLGSRSHGSHGRQTAAAGGEPACLSSWCSPIDSAIVRKLQLDSLNRLARLHTKQVHDFGDWLDKSSMFGLIKQESHCGPRNYVYAPTRAADSSRLAKGLARYPSHVGIYRNWPGVEGYLCAGSLVSERHVLTLASCVAGQNPASLHLRLDEWPSNGPAPAAGAEQPEAAQEPVVARVASVELSPRYLKSRPQSNVALLSLVEPVRYGARDLRFSPACLAGTGSMLSAAECWSPARTLDKQVKFDPDGEGGARVELRPGHRELPVELAPYSDADCAKSSGVESFSVRHPDLLCAASSAGRKALNTTQSFGAGIYCNEGGMLTLVSLVQPMGANQTSLPGYLDLTFYKPWLYSRMFCSSADGEDCSREGS